MSNKFEGFIRILLILTGMLIIFISANEMPDVGVQLAVMQIYRYQLIGFITALCGIFFPADLIRGFEEAIRINSENPE